MEGNERAEIIRRAGSHGITASQRSTTDNEACWRVSSCRRPWCLSCISLSSAAQPTQSARRRSSTRSSASTRHHSSCRRSNPKGCRANTTPGATSSAEAGFHCSEDGPATSSSSHAKAAPGSAPATSKEHANPTASGQGKSTAMPVRVQVPKTVPAVGRLHHHPP
jgi:hypothetical protein